MLILLSPAKSLDFNSPLPTKKHTLPRLLDDSEILVQKLRSMTPAELSQLMNISEKLATLNAERYATWERDFTLENSRQALFAFTGDVYQGLNLTDWNTEDFNLAQRQLRILSGLYGVLRPLDLIQPYRLEMGTKLNTDRGSNLYQFWGDKITDLLNQDLKKSGSDLVVNLASNEYFKAVNKKKLNGTIISPVFKDEKNGTYKIISFYAKKARGMMTDFLIRNRITNADDIKHFNTAGYKYSPAESSDDKPTFLRASS